MYGAPVIRLSRVIKKGFYVELQLYLRNTANWKLNKVEMTFMAVQDRSKLNNYLPQHPQGSSSQLQYNN